MSGTNTLRILPSTIFAASIARAHTYLAFTAFLSALFLGCLLHYRKIVKNDVATYPEEWFPSVSSTIGDWFPERNLFQVLIALTAGPRFALVYLQWYLQTARAPEAYLPSFLFWTGVVRTFMCGGWVYVPSYEAHNLHDVAMIGYIVCNIPWMIGTWASSTSSRARTYRRTVAGSFFGALIPLVYFFLKHKVDRVPGAYSYYALFEWSLIFSDVLFDGISEIEFREAHLQVAVGPFLDRGFAGRAGSVTADEINGDEKIAAAPASPHSSSAAAASGSSSANGSARESLWQGLLKQALTQRNRPTSLRFASDVYLSYIYWTMLTSLAPSFFYYSVWQLGVAGQEVTLLTTMSPILLAIPPIHDWVLTQAGRTSLWMGGLLGVACYISNLPIVRMLCVGLANACLSMIKASDWSKTEDAAYEGLLLGLGLVLSSVLKHANHSNNPVWPILNEHSGGYNKTGLLLALATLYETCTRPSTQNTRPSSSRIDAASTSSRSSVPTKKAVTAISGWLPASLAFASLVFSLHSLLAESSTLIAWSWTGYPISGPVPNLHGGITLLAQAFGLLVPIVIWQLASTSSTTNTSHSTVVYGSYVDVVLNPAWFAFGTASAYTLYSYSDWTGYAGGIGLTVFLMSIIPAITQRVATVATVRGPGMVFMTVWLAVSMFNFCSVMTVAYAFVPGAQILRERTDVVLVAQLLLLAPMFSKSSPNSATQTAKIPTGTGSYTRTFLACTSILAVVSTIYRLPKDSPRPYQAGPRIVRAGIWTVHFGVDEAGRDSQRRMRDLIKDMNLDIVGLLETDLHRIPYGNRDLTRVISEELNYFVDLGPGPNKHTWGAVLLSKYPILKSTHHLLPSPHGELAPAIEAVLDVYGTDITVIVAHNGQEEDALDRELQSTELARIMNATYPNPLIFLGYVVTKPLALRPSPYEIMVTDGRVHDIDEFDWDRWCEYIFYRGLYRTSYSRISRSTITDTELQVGQFIVPPHGEGIPEENDTHDMRYSRSFKEALPEEHWFPMEYYGNKDKGGVRGHFYHVFNTPLYYKWPGMPAKDV